MDKTKRYFWDKQRNIIIAEQKLRAAFDEIKATDSEFSSKYSSFEQYIEACCSESGSLQLLRKGPGQFDGSNADAVYQFLALLEAICSSGKTGYDVKIIVDGYILEAYDHAALMQGLIDAVRYYAEEIS